MITGEIFSRNKVILLHQKFTFLISVSNCFFKLIFQNVFYLFIIKFKNF